MVKANYVPGNEHPGMRLLRVICVLRGNIKPFADKFRCSWDPLACCDVPPTLLLFFCNIIPNATYNRIPR